MSKPEDTYNHDGVECPHCHHVQRDSWELGDGGEGSGETECGACEELILWTRNVHVSYSAKAANQ